MSVVCPFSKILTGQRDGTGFPGNDKNLSRDRRSGKNGKLQSLVELVCHIFRYFSLLCTISFGHHLMKRLDKETLDARFFMVYKNMCSAYISGVFLRCAKINRFY